MNPKFLIFPLFFFVFVLISCKKENNPPTIIDQTFSVKENSTPGLICASANASDPDRDKLKYELTGDDEGLPFELDPGNGNIRIKQTASLDYEKVQQYKFQIKISDGKESASASITINITDQLENPSIVDQSFTVNENVAGLFSVGLIKLESKGEKEEFNFSIIEGNDLELFYIGEKSGELFLADDKFLDYEKNSTYSIQIKVQNRTNTSFYTIINVGIIVIDINEKPLIADQTFNVPENSENDTQIGTLIATDPDSGQLLNFFILESSFDNAVKIDSGTGKLLVADKLKLDHEKVNTITLSIKVTDNGTSSISDTAKVTINVQDVDERPTISTNKLQVEENSEYGEVVGNIVAKSYSGASLEYSIVSGDGLGKFSIVKNTGQIAVSQSAALNYEEKKSYSLNVKVNEVESPEVYSNATVIINILDANEAPTINNQEFTAFNPSIGTLVCGTLTASDPDFGQTLTYSIEDGNDEGYFSVNSTTGGILLTKPVNMNGKDEIDYKLKIRVSDNGINSLFSEAEVGIIVKQRVEIPQNGLVAYYPFNGNATDESINSYDGWVSGPILANDRNENANSAFAFDGSNDYVDLGSEIGDGIRSISLWFRLDKDINASLDRNVALVTREGDYNNFSEFSLAFFPSGLGGTGTPGKLRFFYSVNKENYYDVQSNSSSWQKGRWYHVVAIIDPYEGMKMYIDNIKQADTEGYYNATEHCQLDTYIGSWGTLPNRYFIGKIDDVIFYNRALTETEVSELFKQ